MAATTGQLGLVTPTQGTLSGTWGDTVNNGITEYVNIAIAGTLSFAGDGAITLANTTGDSTATNIGGTTAQYMVIRITGTLTTTKVITAPSYSKLYMVENAATGGTVTFKASGQTGISVAVGERCFAYYNGTDYVKVAANLLTALSGTLATTQGGTGLTSFTSGGAVYASSTSALATGTLPTTAGGTALTSFTSGGAVYATSTSALTTGTLPVASGGTGLTSGTSGGVLAYTASGTLASSAALTANKMVIGGGAGVAPSTTTVFGTAAAVTTGTFAQAVGYADTVVALGNTGTAINLDVTGGNVFTATLTGNATITLRYPVATGSSSFTLILTNDATAGRTVAWAGGTFKFPGGAASLSRTTTANAIDVWFFFTPDGGTTWYGTIPMKNLTT